MLRQIDAVSRFTVAWRSLHVRAVLRQLRIRLPGGMWSASEFLGGELLVGGAGLHESAAVACRPGVLARRAMLSENKLNFI